LVDAVYVIAPESGDVLEKILEVVIASGGTSLNCRIEAIKHVSNKMATREILKKNGLMVPRTVSLDMNEKTENIKHLLAELEYPLVFKPIDGVSCEGLSVVKNNKDISDAVKKISKVTIKKQFIVQKFIIGKAVSACVISTGNKASAISLNRQLITLAPPRDKSTYDGGVVPFNHQLRKEALRAAEKAVETINGLKGYVGVDMILTKEGPVVIEINPRLTTSYIGLKRATKLNIAKVIIDAVICRKLPSNMQTKGFTFFSKVEVPSCPQKLDETYKLKDVVSPPFPIEENKVHALIASASNSPRSAQSRFYQTKEHLLSLYGSD
jgi:predicted ATP-grasp superfamily ATP-dependent carboligase